MADTSQALQALGRRDPCEAMSALKTQEWKN